MSPRSPRFDDLERRVQDALGGDGAPPTDAVLARIRGRSPRAVRDEIFVQRLRRFCAAAGLLLAVVSVPRFMASRAGEALAPAASRGDGASRSGNDLLALVTPADPETESATADGVLADLFVPTEPEDSE